VTTGITRVRIVANEMHLDDLMWQGLRERTQGILKDFRTHGARQVNLRLNESEQEQTRPVFIDWVALPSVTARIARRSLESDIGKYRLGEGTPSQVYKEGVALAGKKIIERDWKCKQLLREKRVESKLAVQKAGLMYQKFIGIIGGDPGKWRCVGLLTVSFEKKPKGVNLVKVEEKMKRLASWPDKPKSDPVKSDFVKYLEEVFVLGGPLVKGL
jgi:hypothetical protein